MSAYSPTRSNGNGGTDIEMSDVRLLDEDDMDDTLPFGQSNQTSVLANPDFVRRRCLSLQFHDLVSFCSSKTSLNDVCFSQALGQVCQLSSGAASPFVQLSDCR